LVAQAQAPAAQIALGQAAVGQMNYVALYRTEPPATFKNIVQELTPDGLSSQQKRAAARCLREMADMFDQAAEGDLI